MRGFPGRYRATVVDNEDPLQQGRLRIQRRAEPRVAPTWATPDLTIDGRCEDHGAAPAIGTTVWIEFESGDLDTPIWFGLPRVDESAAADPMTKLFGAQGRGRPRLGQLGRGVPLLRPPPRRRHLRVAVTLEPGGLTLSALEDDEDDEL